MPDKQISERTTTTTRTVVEKKPRRELLSNILAIAGLVILAIVVIWGLLHIATIVAPSFSSLFSSPSKITITAPASATSGTPFAVSWKYSTSEKGAYAFLYQCKNGLRFDTAIASSTYAIPCGAGYTVGAVSTLSLVPHLSASTSVDAPFSIIFIPSATTSTSSGQASSKQVQGSATVKINPAATPVQPAQTTKQAPAKTTTYTSPHTAGPADLSVSITSATADQYGNAVVVFDIGNVGGSASGSYYFSAQLPTSGGYPYTSPQQASLGAGDHMVNTLRFSQAVPGTFSVSLSVSDANQSNNYASTVLSMPSAYAPGYGGTQYYNNYNQPTYYTNQYNQQYPNYNPYPIVY